MVSRHLDYGNSILSGIADRDLTKPQRAQNRLVCAVTVSTFYSWRSFARVMQHNDVNYLIMQSVNFE